MGGGNEIVPEAARTTLRAVLVCYGTPRAKFDLRSDLTL